MKAGSGKRKGGAFERLVCKQLSLWWSGGKRDDIFFRTASSGGRATQRAKKGKKTFGQYGDIQAADPLGQPLMDLCIIECKDGYASDNIADLLDCESRHNPKYLQFIQQASKSCTQSHAEYWMLVARRRGRQIMVYIPLGLFESSPFRDNRTHLIPRAVLRLSNGMIIVTFPFETMLENVPAEDFK